jgi:polypeptide N-acetylgalactosaminyltransferase
MHRAQRGVGWLCCFKILLIGGIVFPLSTAGVYWIICSGSETFTQWNVISRNNKLLNLLQNFPTDETTDFDIYSLNVQLSNRIPLDRSLPDTRPEDCSRIQYDTEVKVSVLIPMYDESWSMLLRMLHSVVDRTPDDVLEEIILVDDKSTYDYLRDPLDVYIRQLSPKIQIIRSKHREGLMRARMTAAKRAKGEILVFLDAHVECNEGWLEPLLQIILEHPRSIAVPTIDNIDPLTIEYSNWTYTVYGGFTWNMDYEWKVLPEHITSLLKSRSQPYATPTTIGCAMTVRRDYFFDLGGFDEGMYIWGGENIEISFRTWMCGDGLFISPCSRVGHLFRVILPYVFPYLYGGGMVRQKNYQRVAEVWMDDYKQLYYASTGVRVNMTRSELSSLKDRMALRERLHCHDFKWFLANVIPEMPIPQPTAQYFGQIKSMKDMSCLLLQGSLASLSFCGVHTTNQYFTLTTNMHILSYNGSQCLSANPDATSVNFEDCDPQQHRQMWIYNPKETQYGAPICVYPRGRDASVARCLVLLQNNALSLRDVTPELSMDFQWSFTNKFHQI